MAQSDGDGQLKVMVCEFRRGCWLFFIFMLILELRATICLW